MSYDVPTGYITVREARDRLHDSLCPDAQYSLGDPDMSVPEPPDGWDLNAEPPRVRPLIGYTLNICDDRMASIDQRLIAALRDGALVAWYEAAGEVRRLLPDYWGGEG